MSDRGTTGGSRDGSGRKRESSRSRRARKLRQRQLIRKRVLIGLGAVAIVAVLASAVIGFQTFQARKSLLVAESSAQQLKDQLKTGNGKAAATTLVQLQGSTHSARSHTDGLLWNMGGAVPFVGRNVKAVQTVSRVLDDIAKDGLPPIVEVADQINADTFSPRNGRVDIGAMKDVASRILKADVVLTQGKLDLEGIKTKGLLGPLGRPVLRLQEKINDAQSAASSGSIAARLMPEMLGGSEKRTYALIFQNNAELRSSGGLPGAFALIKARDGRINMVSQGSSTDFPYFDPPIVKLTADERSMYSNLMANFWGDTNFTPNFPRTAEIMRAMLIKKFDQKVDGVLSVDPVAMSYVLKGTGPIKLADGTMLNSENAVKLLLNGVYLKFGNDPKAQDDYFADAAKRVFNAMADGQGDALTVLEGLAKGVSENRVLVNTSRKPEQQVIASTRIAGVLPVDDGETPHVGLYLNDATETKLEYYLSRRSTVQATRCTSNGVQTLTTKTVLKSTAPKNVASLSRSIVGPNTGEKPGSMRIALSFYVPWGGNVTDLAVNGKSQTINRSTLDRLNVITLPVLLAPGQKVTVTTSMFTGENQRADAIFATTPGIESTPNNVKVASACN